MQAGMRDRQISLRRKPSGKDEFGQSISNTSNPMDWDEITEIWASYKPVSDGEKWRSGQVEVASIGWFTVRNSDVVSDLSLTDVLIFDGGVWSISGIKPIGRRRMLEITATRKGAGAAL
jgi:head-tail adaptor